LRKYPIQLRFYLELYIIAYFRLGKVPRFNESENILDRQIQMKLLSNLLR